MKTKITFILFFLLSAFTVISFAHTPSSAITSINTENFYCAGSEDSNYYIEALLDKYHFDSCENINISVVINENFEIKSTNYFIDGLIIVNEHIADNQLDLSLACFDHSTKGRIEISVINNFDVANKIDLFVFNNEHGAFISTNGFEDAMEKWFGFAMDNKIMTHNEYQDIISPLCAMEEIVTPNTIDINDHIIQNEINSTFENAFRIKCTFLWQADNLNIYPQRNAKVELYIRNKTTNNFELHTVTSTDDDGKINIFLATPPTSGYDLYMRIYAADITENITVRKNANNEIYFTSTETYIGRTTDITSTFISNIAYTSSYTLHALQIFQAVKTARDFAQEMMGRLPNDVAVLYPHDQTGNAQNSCFYNRPNLSDTSTINDIGTIHIPYFESSKNLKVYACWDAIMHEYGHHVSYHSEIGVADFTGGIAHDVFDNQCDVFYSSSPSTAKHLGIHLAWGEAWPTIFALVAQDYYKTLIGGTNGIAYACDNVYNSYKYGDDYSVEESNEYTFNGDGCELNIMMVLWDLFDDPVNDDDPFSMTYTQFWNVITENHAKTFSEFIQGFYDDHPSYTHAIGSLLEECRIAPYKLDTDDDYPISQDSPPVFNWKAGGGSKYFPNNNFVLIFYNEAGIPILYTDEIYTTTYALSDEEWNDILYSYPNDDEYLVAISAIQTDEPVTGEYISKLYRLYKLPNVIEGSYIYFESYTRYYDETATIGGGDSIKHRFFTWNEGTYIFQTTGAAYTRLSIYYDNTLVATNTGGGAGNNAYICVDLLAGEEYEIVVHKLFYNETTVPIRLVITLGEEYEDTEVYSIESFESLEDIGTSIPITIWDSVWSYEARLFKFTATESGEYNFEIYGDTDLSIYVINTSETGTTVWGVDFAHSGDYYIDFTPTLEAGVEYFVMIHLDPWVDDIYSYELTITYLG